jgi:hypothetical protein
MNKKLSRTRSGQALIITALIITLLLMSTAYYVLKIERTAMTSQPAGSMFPTIKLSTRNAVTSALANISNGGAKDILDMDLKELSVAVEDEAYDGQCDLSFELFNSTPYSDGTYISWGDNALGISSAYVAFTVNFSGISTNFNSEYKLNITTALAVQSVYTSEGDEKDVDVTCMVYNDENLALAENITLYYQNETGGPFILVGSANNLETVDYGNGTYLMSFKATTQTSLQVSAQVHDLRNIFVVANTTCTEA